MVLSQLASLFVLACVSLLFDSAYAQPPCISSKDDLGYVNGTISTTQTFYNCQANIPDPGMIPSYYNNKYNGIVNFQSSMTLQNLVKIDEVEGTCTLTFSLGTSWIDSRYSMPVFWSSIAPTKAITLTDVILNDSVVMFSPQLHFPDALDVNIIIQDLTLSNKNLFIWKAAITVTLSQPDFQFKKYPGDSQTLNIQFYVYPYNNKTVTMSIFEKGIYFAQDQNGQSSFTKNAIWSYESSEASSYLSRGASSSTSYALFQIVVSRKGSGIVLRLVVPLLLLLLLSAMTFWANYEERVNVTITILLSVSALYIVILNNIPMVGYLTDLDKFVFWMFLLLVVVVILHQAYSTIQQKHERWPLRPFYLRVVEATGRIFILPAILLYFMVQIPIATTQAMKESILAGVVTISSLITCREAFGLKGALKASLEGLLTKINDPDTSMSDLSVVEILVMNIWKFGIVSISAVHISAMLKNAEKITSDFKAGVRLRHVVTLNNEDDQLREKKRKSKNRSLWMDRIIRRSSSQSHEDEESKDIQLVERIARKGKQPVRMEFVQDLDCSGVVNPMALHAGAGAGAGAGQADIEAGAGAGAGAGATSSFARRSEHVVDSDDE